MVCQMCSWDWETGSPPVSGGQEGSAPSVCGECFPQAEQPAWPQLSKPQALGEDEEEKGGLEEEKGGLGGSSGESGELGKGQTG